MSATPQPHPRGAAPSAFKGSPPPEEETGWVRISLRSGPQVATLPSRPSIEPSVMMDDDRYRLRDASGIGVETYLLLAVRTASGPQADRNACGPDRKTTRFEPIQFLPEER